MDRQLQQAFVNGYERMASWSDLLDQINVFPVADADTGRNLKISLAPLRRLNDNQKSVAEGLLRSATGNSGNIAGRFLHALLKSDSPSDLFKVVRLGREAAWKAVVDPKPGTMLTVFSALEEFMASQGPAMNSFTDKAYVNALVGHLENSVRATTQLLPVLKTAGVVDAGALGIFLFLEAFFARLAGQTQAFAPVTEVFSGRLSIADAFEAETRDGYCIDTLIQSQQISPADMQAIAELGESIVVVPENSYVKIHLHAADRQAVRKKMESLGNVVQWSDAPLDNRLEKEQEKGPQPCIHIMTDAAGAVTLADARKLKMTLLDSYLLLGEKCLPETLISPEELYTSMRKGQKVSTAQASVYERHQCYASALALHRRVLYLCVGSVYTGNFDIARVWKMENDPLDQFTIIDTGAASGRLGMIALATARYALKEKDIQKTINFAATAVGKCEEYIFLDRLKYLAAGGRLSKTSGFFGDLLHMKPIISPRAEGAQKVGVVKNQAEQVAFALEKLETRFSSGDAPLIMLEYSDNHAFVQAVAETEVKKRFPGAEVILQPLSLTSGAHMGPGTWALAFLPQPSWKEGNLH